MFYFLALCSHEQGHWVDLHLQDVAKVVPGPRVMRQGHLQALLQCLSACKARHCQVHMSTHTSGFADIMGPRLKAACQY